MGAYRFLNEQSNDTPGIIRTDTGATIPPDLGNNHWLEYLAWKAAPNTPDVALVPALGEERSKQKALLDAAAELETVKTLQLGAPVSAGPGVAFLHLKLIQEAIEVDGVGSPAAARYPMLNEQIPNEGATITDVGTALRTWWDAKKVRLGDIENLRRKAHKDIDDAGTLTAIRAIVPAVTWPA